MITGVHPFEADSSVSCAVKRLNERPLPPGKLVPGLSARWEKVILKCLERNPGQRFATAYDVEEAFREETIVLWPGFFRKIRLAAVGFAFLLLVIFLGYSVQSRVMPRNPTPSVWQLQTIQENLDAGKEVIWQENWTDITWIGPERWLSAELDTGGVSGDIGRGILLHTKDGGTSWTEVNSEKFNSGHGTFPWGPHGDTQYSWQDMGPIYSIKAFSRHLGGGERRVEIWLAAVSGIYASNNDGETWQRSTPRPDDHRQSEIYAHFAALGQLEAFREVYATGWPGIAHWSSSNKAWKLELPAYTFGIGAIDIEPGYSYPEIWAVGNSLPQEPYGFIYHLKQPEHVWERLFVKGNTLEPGQGPSDVRIIDFNTGFAVGGKGLILKGSKSKDGVWTWTSIPSPTRESLNSIEYVNGTLWVVGNDGVVLNSRDRGQTWVVDILRDQSGRVAGILKRIRCFGDDSFWIVGNGMLYKHWQSQSAMYLWQPIKVRGLTLINRLRLHSEGLQAVLSRNLSPLVLRIPLLHLEPYRLDHYPVFRIVVVIQQ
jgi:hypothetical protein